MVNKDTLDNKFKNNQNMGNIETTDFVDELCGIDPDCESEVKSLEKKYKCQISCSQLSYNMVYESKMNSEITQDKRKDARIWLSHIRFDTWISLKSIPDNISSTVIALICKGDHLHNIIFNDSYELIKKIGK